MTMRATVMYGAGDVRIENVPEARLIEPTDALVAVTCAAICGSDLWPYKTMEPGEAGRRMGHEFIGIVEAVGTDVQTVKAGDVVVSPFLWSDGTCVFCQEGLQSDCLHGGRYGSDDVDGGQGEAVRVPQADGTLVVLPVPVAQSAASGCRRRTRSPTRSRPSSRTSPSAVDPRPSAPTSRSCSRTSSRARSRRAGSSIGWSASTRCPTATGR